VVWVNVLVCALAFGLGTGSKWFTGSGTGCCDKAAAGAAAIAGEGALALGVVWVNVLVLAFGFGLGTGS